MHSAQCTVRWIGVAILGTHLPDRRLCSIPLNNLEAEIEEVDIALVHGRRSDGRALDDTELLLALHREKARGVRFSLNGCKPTGNAAAEKAWSSPRKERKKMVTLARISLTVLRDVARRQEIAELYSLVR